MLAQVLTQLESILYSFAREFGMMDAGRDTEGLWHMMDIAVVYVLLISLHCKWYTSSLLLKSSKCGGLALNHPLDLPFLESFTWCR